MLTMAVYLEKLCSEIATNSVSIGINRAWIPLLEDMKEVTFVKHIFMGSRLKIRACIIITIYRLFYVKI
jgi:hypothetical protein